MRTRPSCTLRYGQRGIPALLLCAASVMSVAAPHPEAQSKQSHPPYQVDEKVTAPRIFAEGVISTPEDEIGGTFSPDGMEFYFSRLVSYTTFPRISVMCVSYFRDEHW